MIKADGSDGVIFDIVVDDEEFEPATLSADRLKSAVVKQIQADPKLLRVLEEGAAIKHSSSSYESDQFLFEFAVTAADL